ncbi:MAG: hypothetical protein PWQ97_430 [Tepidanaerobacteraceae bacterium]|nr:hypothetical protein [Tepidanaerobacteraceae bacterium]
MEQTTNQGKRKDGTFILAQKCEDMVLYGYKALQQFPKSEKHTLAAEMKKSMVNIQRLIITANMRYYKKNTIEELDIEKAILMFYLRLSRRLGFLPPKKYEIWSGMLEEIGRLIGGWFKSIWKKEDDYANRQNPRGSAPY